MSLLHLCLLDDHIIFHLHALVGNKVFIMFPRYLKWATLVIFSYVFAVDTFVGRQYSSCATTSIK
jgi:hypothetical protein